MKQKIIFNINEGLCISWRHKNEFWNHDFLQTLVSFEARYTAPPPDSSFRGTKGSTSSSSMMEKEVNFPGTGTEFDYDFDGKLKSSKKKLSNVESLTDRRGISGEYKLKVTNRQNWDLLLVHVSIFRILNGF